jgi:hypothetical protein
LNGGWGCRTQFWKGHTQGPSMPSLAPFGQAVSESLFFILFIIYSCYSYDVQPCLIYIIWSRIFPVTVLYMILILPRHCLIYDPDFSFKEPNHPLSLRLKVSGCHYNSIYNNTWTKQVKQLSKQHQAQWSRRIRIIQLKITLIIFPIWCKIINEIHKKINNISWGRMSEIKHILTLFCYSIILFFIFSPKKYHAPFFKVK